MLDTPQSSSLTGSNENRVEQGDIVLERIWVTQDVGERLDGADRNAHPAHGSASSIHRWLGESMREQPYHNIDAVPQPQTNEARSDSFGLSYGSRQSTAAKATCGSQNAQHSSEEQSKKD